MLKQVLSELHEFAKNNNIPIIEPEGALTLINILEVIKPKRILEIGTAIGYSALLMYSKSNAEIYTIERDEVRYQKAYDTIHPLRLPINLIKADALSVNNDNWGKFDLIYFDAAKAQNIKFFEKYAKNLAPNGIIVIDNLYFHGLVNEPKENIESRNVRQLVRKIKSFIDYANNLEDYNFTILEKGDGIGIITRN